MPTSVLVAYGTTNGSTAQIAEAVAEVLRKGGLIPDLLPARSVMDVTPYDAVVLGSGLYAGRWHRDARRFVSRHGRQLAERPLWLFSSGPLDSSASERDIPPVRGVRRTMVRLGARSHLTFGGCLEEGAKGRIAQSIVRNGKGGDFRDFGAIDDWAARIAAELVAAQQKK
ncbi:flavodoxin domain-containing protein [Streptomyces mirabilis]|uniref:flavodoxin domain-containing protein n=1 Tax=Streptomyces mirabilis TaxID=68239 RepID=UPI003400094D